MEHRYDTILISIIVPIYNVQNYLEKCLDSICGQSYSNIEIILINDGSEDNCQVICDRYAEIDRRIKVIHCKNGGVVSARKAGIKIAQGQYIVCVDGDDWIEKDRIYNLVNNGMAAGQKPDMIYMSGYIKEFEDYETIVQENIAEGILYDEHILEKLSLEWIDTNKCFKNNICYSLCMWVIKKELLQNIQEFIDERITIGEDYICIFLCLLQAKAVRIIRESGYHYLQRSTSITHTVSKDESYRLKIWYQQLKHYLISADVSASVMKAFTFSAIRLFLMTDYSLLLDDKREFLFPFTKVGANSRIVIYGVGRMGYSLMNALKKCSNYKIVGLVDQKVKKASNTELQISDISEIHTMVYDYLVITILDEDIARDIKRKLISIGIPEEKIALMDRRVIRDDMISQSFQENFNILR